MGLDGILMNSIKIRIIIEIKQMNAKKMELD